MAKPKTIKFWSTCAYLNRNELTALKLQYASEGKYTKANQTLQKIKQMEQDFILKKKEDLNRTHFAELKMLEEELEGNIERCNQKHDDKINELEEYANESRERMTAKHEQEAEKMYEETEKNLPKVVKHSREYLQLRKAEEMLVRQQKFEDAEVLSKKCKALEKNELEEFTKQRNKIIESNSLKLGKKHKLERDAMEEKLKLSSQELNNERTEELKM